MSLRDINDRKDVIAEKLKDYLTLDQIRQIEVIMGIKNSTQKRANAIVESVEIDPRLIRFAEMYNRWSKGCKSRKSWKKVQDALLANDAELLQRVEALPNGPLMFGIDHDGNILFANGGLMPILTGMNYWDARKAAKELGLELFPLDFSSWGCVSEEILIFKHFMGGSMVRPVQLSPWSPGKAKDNVSTWLEYAKDEEKDSRTYIMTFCPAANASAAPDEVDVNEVDERCGVRGLLRAKA